MANSFSKGRVKVLPVPRGDLHKILNDLIGKLEPNEAITIDVVPVEGDDLQVVIMVNWNS